MDNLSERKRIVKHLKDNPDSAKVIADGFGKDVADMVFLHETSSVVRCDHEWDNDGCNPEFCEKCGASFTSYAFMECE